MPSARTPRTMSSTRSNCVAVRHVAPGRAHAEPRRALRARLARGRQRLVDAHQSVAIDAGLVVRRLRAVGAVFRTAAGLDAEQHAALHFVPARDARDGQLRAEHQVEQRRGVNRFDFPDGPVVAAVRHRSLLYPVEPDAVCNLPVDGQARYRSASITQELHDAEEVAGEHVFRERREPDLGPARIHASDDQCGTVGFERVRQIEFVAVKTAVVRSKLRAASARA